MTKAATLTYPVSKDGEEWGGVVEVVIVVALDAGTLSENPATKQAYPKKKPDFHHGSRASSINLMLTPHTRRGCWHE